MSDLNLEQIVFDKIEFKRLGFKNDNDPKFELQTSVGINESQKAFKVTLVLTVNKEEEYNLEISLTGYFSINDNNMLTDEETMFIVRNNTVAILMPYLRSEVSLVTAQPNMECIVLPVFNINNLLQE